MTKDEIINNLKLENSRLKDELTRIQYAVYKCNETVVNNPPLGTMLGTDFKKMSPNSHRQA